MPKYITWLVTFMMSQSPPGNPNWFGPSAKETKEEGEVRYNSIAQDIAAVTIEQPPLFTGPQGRIKTAGVMLAIMKFESNFRRDVDLGIGKEARGDGGNSICLMQLNIGQGRSTEWNTKENRRPLWDDPKGDIFIGWKMDEILADRKKCITAGYRVMKVSFGKAATSPPLEWLRVYASGKWDGGIPESRARMGLALKYYADHTPDFNDSDFMPAK